MIDLRHFKIDVKLSKLRPILGIKTALKLLFALAAVLLSEKIAISAPPYPEPSYYVSVLGNDGAAGTSAAPFKTIAKAVSVAQPGQLVQVSSGSYNETLKSVRSGTSAAPIVFKAEGVVNIGGARLNHSYLVLAGFSMDGNHPDITGFQGVVTVGRDAVGCVVAGNTIHDWKASVYGIHFDAGSGRAPTDCTIENNTLIGAGFHMIDVIGSRHRIERNTLNTSNGWDAMRVFGDHQVIRANYFTAINEKTGVGNHVDIIQGFDDIGSEAHDILFEHNFIYDSKTQMGQINNDRYSTLVYNWTFRDNVFAKMYTPYNLNASVKGVTFANNTVLTTGQVILGQISDDSVIHSNAFIGNGSGSTGNGWYSSPGGKLYPGMFNKWTGPLVDCTGLADAACLEARSNLGKNLLLQLQGHGFLGSPNGNFEYPILSSISTVTVSSQLGLTAPFTSFEDVVLSSAQAAFHAKQVFRANNNFVAGAAPTFAAKATNCPVPYNPFNFCETGGINGGDPQFQNVNDPLGPDGLPFTTDDGLRPVPSSRLCSGGENSGPIGAYPCSGPLEPVGSGTGYTPPPTSPPAPPSNLTVSG